MIRGMIKVKERLGESGMQELAQRLADAANLQVFVGIPEDAASRRPTVGPNGQVIQPKINNAQLLYIHTNGSPLKRIPKRPVIEPAIEAPDNRMRIEAELSKAAEHIFNGEHAKALASLKRAGMLGRDAAKGWFTDPRNGWPPNTAATVRAKLAKMGAGPEKNAALAAIQTEYVRRRITSHYGPGRGFLSRDVNRQEASGTYQWNGDTVSVDTPLIDTGALRQSITYIVMDNGQAAEEGSH